MLDALTEHYFGQCRVLFSWKENLMTDDAKAREREVFEKMCYVKIRYQWSSR